jgi:hypothetical protein
MKQNLNYKFPFLVWILSILMAPIVVGIVLLIMGIGRTELYELFAILIYLVIGGIIILVPAVLVTQVAFTFLAKFMRSQIWLRVSFGIVATLFLCLVLYLADVQYFVYSDLILAICYSLSLISISLLLPIEAKRRVNADNLVS